MIALVSGTVAVRRSDYVVVDCGGVGYRLSVSSETLRQCAGRAGKHVMLHTHLVTREDALLLYGFATEDETRPLPSGSSSSCARRLGSRCPSGRSTSCAAMTRARSRARA